MPFLSNKRLNGGYRSPPRPTDLIKPSSTEIKSSTLEIFLNERVDEVKQEKNNWVVKTNNKNQFIF